MISREDAISELEQLKQTFYDLEIGNTVTSALCMAIEALSTERPKGWWIKEIHTGLIGDTNEYNDTYFFRCSICGRTVFEKEPYCHCGADMREEKENER